MNSVYIFIYLVLCLPTHPLYEPSVRAGEAPAFGELVVTASKGECQSLQQAVQEQFDVDPHKEHQQLKLNVCQEFKLPVGV